MSDTVLPAEVAEKFWSRVSTLNVAPSSEKLNALRICAQDVARMIGPALSLVEATDRLYAAATAAGVVSKWGDDEVQKVLAEALELASSESVDDDEVDDEARPPEFSDEMLALQFAERHGDVRYVAVWNRWLLWTGTRWLQDDTLQALNLSRRLCREIASKCEREKIAMLIAHEKNKFSSR